MDETRHLEREPGSAPLPCDYFDLIARTGTGGLIAVMLGRLRMSVEECLTAFTEIIFRTLFEERKNISLSRQYKDTMVLDDRLQNLVYNRSQYLGERDSDRTTTTLQSDASARSKM